MSSDRRPGGVTDRDVAASPPTAPTALPVGGPPAVLGGRYEMGRRIGGGGAATVYTARDMVLGRTVAVKVMRSDGEADQADRFDQEARLLASLSHPGLVTVFDAGSSVDGRGDPQAFLVMELVDGTTLSQRLRGGPLAAQEAADIGRRLASALAYVHAQGIVHRDVKPANVLLTPPAPDRPPVAKLTDFGIARLVESDRMTMQGFTVGTANYLSPEQATGGEVGPPADVYSLGLLLLECLTGVMAYPGHGVEAASARLHRPPDIPASVPSAWAELITAMTQLDPARRVSAADAAVTLARLRAGDAPVEQTRVLPVVAPSVLAGARRRFRHRWRPPVGWLPAALVAAGVFFVAVIAALAFGSIGAPAVQPPAAAHTTSSTPSQPQAVVARSTTPSPSSTPTRTTHAAVPVQHAPAPAAPKHRKHAGGHDG